VLYHRKKILGFEVPIMEKYCIDVNYVNCDKIYEANYCSEDKIIPFIKKRRCTNSPFQILLRGVFGVIRKSGGGGGYFHVLLHYYEQIFQSFLKGSNPPPHPPSCDLDQQLYQFKTKREKERERERETERKRDRERERELFMTTPKSI
jgi:hypothetical protein